MLIETDEATSFAPAIISGEASLNSPPLLPEHAADAARSPSPARAKSKAHETCTRRRAQACKRAFEVPVALHTASVLQEGRKDANIHASLWEPSGGSRLMSRFPIGVAFAIGNYFLRLGSFAQRSRQRTTRVHGLAQNTKPYDH
jgi:hypothetical protein